VPRGTYTSFSALLECTRRDAFMGCKNIISLFHHQSMESSMTKLANPMFEPFHNTRATIKIFYDETAMTVYRDRKSETVQITLTHYNALNNLHYMQNLAALSIFRAAKGEDEF
jgi:hypothetical protein